MVQMIYMGDGHTLVEQKGTREKMKVVNGEIIEVEDAMVGRMRLGGFQVFDEDVNYDAPKEKAEDAPFVPTIEDFTKAQLIAIAEKHGFNLGVNSKDKAISTNDSVAVIVGAITPFVTPELIQAEYDILQAEKVPDSEADAE